MADDRDKATLLVVDDMPENIDLLVGLLKERYKVKAARSGEIALKIAHSANPPDLILLDVNMPEMDGFEVCRQLRANTETASIPVIFVSGEIGNEEHAQGAALGAVAYLTKPVEPDRLNVALDTALN